MKTLVIGSVPFVGKKQKDREWRKLRRELGSEARIWVEDNMVFYRYKQVLNY